MFRHRIHPLLSLYQSSETLPSDEEIQQAHTLVYYHELKIGENAVRFGQLGMSITLNGIAKGFIVDEGVVELQNFDFSNVMVEVGGDLMALGEKNTQSPWKMHSTILKPYPRLLITYQPSPSQSKQGGK
ncbi:MAG: hypothetical protein GY755_23200 [Chloroflexi bacterium]|nr:hypothetical protein [Chloroflexota bacterium]